MAKQAFVLYSTEGCHLCEMAYELVVALGRTADVQVIDIVDDDALVERYGTTIPVIAHLTSGVELGWPFDEDRLQAFFSALIQ